MSRIITNATLWTTDFAWLERQAFLRKLSRTNFRRRGTLRHADYQTYALASDPRSVRYQLNGRKPLRVAWWAVFRTVHQVIFRSNLEGAMCAYHSLHHEITYLRVKTWHRSLDLVDAMHEHGFLKGLWSHCRVTAEALKRPSEQD